MDLIITVLENYGYWGMFIAAFVAGSFLPWSSEAIMIGMLAAGLEPLGLFIYATAGNVLGSMFNYWIGTLGRIDWIERFLHVKKESLDKAQRFMSGHGAWIGFFTFLPVIGTAIAITLGLMRANIVITLVSITLGKAFRYAVLAYGVGGLL